MRWVEKYLFDKISQQKVIHLTLIDPDKMTPSKAAIIAKVAMEAGTTAIMIGGSTVVSVTNLDEILKAIKKNINIPTILFPNNITGISRYADAIWFMSLLNSTNPYFITGSQALGAPLIRRYGLEPLSMGYIIVGRGGTVAFIGQANPIPYTKPEAATLYALAAQYLGMHFVYLEAGSGAKRPVPPEMISIVKRSIDIPLIIGGGIRDLNLAKTAAKAGADIVVTGTLAEDEEHIVKTRITEIVGILKNVNDKRNQ